MRINCIAIEDEPLALNKIKKFIKQVEYLNLLDVFNNAVDAISFLKYNTVDLIFLDIRMKNLSGIQFLESLKTSPKVIITSAYDEYALKGYELDVSDYLLKPFSFERFLKSSEKVYEELTTSTKEDNRSFIFVKTEFRIERVEFDRIQYIQGMKDYLQIHTTDKKIMTLQTFKCLEASLPKTQFTRVHNSYIVAISKIESIERNRIRIGDEVIPITDTYKERFYQLLVDEKIFI